MKRLSADTEQLPGTADFCILRYEDGVKHHITCLQTAEGAGAFFIVVKQKNWFDT